MPRRLLIFESGLQTRISTEFYTGLNFFKRVLVDL